MISLLILIFNASPFFISAFADTASLALDKIDQLIVQKKYEEAIDTSISSFKLDRSECRNIRTGTIDAKNNEGMDITAKTTLDQNIILDPKRFAFKNARYLVSVLSHEITHCRQHESIYQLSRNSDPRLKTFAKKITSLRILADLEELTGRIADKTNKNSGPDLQLFQQKIAVLQIDATPEQIEAYATDVVSDILTLNHTLNELKEMEASLEAFHHSDILPPPASEALADVEFSFQFRYLMTATSTFLRHRALLGMNGSNLCKLSNFVPTGLLGRYEKVCDESINYLQKFLKNVP